MPDRYKTYTKVTQIVFVIMLIYKCYENDSFLNSIINSFLFWLSGSVLHLSNAIYNTLDGIQLKTLNGVV